MFGIKQPTATLTIMNHFLNKTLVQMDFIFSLLHTKYCRSKLINSPALTIEPHTNITFVIIDRADTGCRTVALSDYQEYDEC